MTTLGVSITSSIPLQDLPGRHLMAHTAMLQGKYEVVNEAGGTLVGYMQDEAPKRTGEFAAAIRHEMFTMTNGAGFNVSIPQPLGGWIMDGTPAHIIAAHGRALRFEIGGNTIFARSVNHPGTKANPFHERALTRWRPEAQSKLHFIASLYVKDFING
jgi:hypothetical protein